MTGSRVVSDDGHGEGHVRPETAAGVSSRPDFAQAYEKYARRVFAFAMRLTCEKSAAEDLLSETMLKALSAFDKQKASQEDLFAWLRTICANIYRDQKRKERVRRMYSQGRQREHRENAAALHGRAQTQQEMESAWDEARQVIDSMTLLQKSCLLMKLAGHSYAEITELFGIDRNQVKSCIQNAMRQLRHKFAPAVGKERT